MNTSKTGSGRRRWTRKQRQRLLARFHESQLTQSDFAIQHGVGLSTLSKWLRLEREAVPAKVKFGSHSNLGSRFQPIVQIGTRSTRRRFLKK
jgi:transposase-like protein